MNNIGYIIAALGIILTVIFGIYAIILQKKNRKKVSLSFDKKLCYGLFKEDVNRLKIDINYKGKVIDNYLILFKGLITNDGNSDIDRSSVYKPLQIIIKDEYKWLEENICNSPEGGKFEINKINQNTLELTWDLIKENESIEFETLIEIPKDKVIPGIEYVFYDSINFDFRITDLKKINKSVDDLFSQSNIIMKYFILLFSVFSIIAGAGMFFSPDFKVLAPFSSITNHIEYEIVNSNDTTYVLLSIKDHNRIKIVNDTLKINKSVDDFNKNYKINKINSISYEQNKPWLQRLMGLVYIILGILMLRVGSKIFKKE